MTHAKRFKCVCQLCRQEFRASRYDAKWCTPACRQLAYRVSHGKSLVIRSKQLIGPNRFPKGSWDSI